MIANDVAKYLEASGLGTIGRDLFVSFQPPNPDDCVTIYDTGGYPPDIDVPLRDPTCQMLVRASDYPVAMAKAQAIFNLLHAKSNYKLGPWRVYLSRAEQEPGPIGVDENERHEVSVNFHFKIREG